MLRTFIGGGTLVPQKVKTRLSLLSKLIRGAVISHLQNVVLSAYFTNRVQVRKVSQKAA